MRPQVVIALFAASALVFAQVATPVTVTHGSFSWTQENCPNVGDEITAGTLGGATFNIASDDTTSAITFPDMVAGGVFDDQVGVLSVLIGDEPNDTRAVNLPYGGNIGEVTERRGLGVGWAPGTVGGGGVALAVPVLPNGPGDDFVIFESGTSGIPDAMMVRVRVANDAGGPYFTPWFYAAEASEEPGSPVLHAWSYDLSDMGLLPVDQIDRIEIANMVAGDRIDAVGTLNGPADPIDAKWTVAGGQFAGSFEFDGADDYGVFESALFDVGSTGTLSYWTRLDDTGKRNQFFEGPGDAGLEYQYRSNGGGQFFGRANAGGDFVIESGGAAAVGGMWVNMQFTWDSATSEMRIYRDGVELAYLGGFDQNLAGFPPVTDTTAGQMNVGRDPGDGSRFLDGGLDDIGWFDGVLDAADRDLVRTQGVAMLAADARLIAHWDLDQASGSVAIDNQNAIELLLDSNEPWVAEGSVLPEVGMPYSMSNPGPDPGPLASFTIPFGNNTFDPDPLYLAALHDLEELGIVDPADAVLGDLVWNDVDGDGTPAGEPGVLGVTVELYGDANGDGMLDGGDPLLGAEVTDAAGFYSFTGLAAGDYLVFVDAAQPAIDNAVRTGGVNPFAATLAISEAVLGADFGFQVESGDAVIGELVWDDRDGDGTSAGEPGIEGVSLELYGDANGDGMLDGGDPLLATEVTDGAGLYLFTGLAAGDYLVFVDPAQAVLLGAPLTCCANPLPVTVGIGEDFRDAAFGFELPQVVEIPAMGRGGALVLVLLLALVGSLILLRRR